MQIKHQITERHTLSILVANEPGALSKITGLFSARGYNIESLTVADISADNEVSRITIVTSGTDHVIEQIVAQLDRLVPVFSVTDMTLGAYFERELALVKIKVQPETHAAALALGEEHAAHVIDTLAESVIFELTASSEVIAQFIAKAQELGQLEVARTGVVAITRG
jgi:acetolactate synthase I/III small subunit